MPRVRKSLSRKQRRTPSRTTPTSPAHSFSATRLSSGPHPAQKAADQDLTEVYVYRAGYKAYWTGWQRWRDFRSGLDNNYPHPRRACPGAADDADTFILAARLGARELGWNGTIADGFFVTGAFPNGAYIIGWESDISSGDDYARVAFFASAMPIPPHPKAVFMGHKAILRAYSPSELIAERSLLVRETHPGAAS